MIAVACILAGVVLLVLVFAAGVNVGMNAYEHAAESRRPCERGEPGALFDYVEPFRGKAEQ